MTQRRLQYARGFEARNLAVLTLPFLRGSEIHRRTLLGGRVEMIDLLAVIASM